MSFLDILTNPIENVLTVIEKTVTGELPTKREVAELINDGVSIVVIANVFDVGVDVIEGIINETGNSSS